MDKTERLQQLHRELFELPLPEGAIQIVPGRGNPESPVVLVGHSPSGSDNQSGRPYSGPAGEILDQLLGEASLQRDDLYITNIVKVWTWKIENAVQVNRTPSATELKAWSKVLKVELETLKPRALVCMGGPTAQHFLGKDFKITQNQGQWFAWPSQSPFLKIVGSIAIAPAVMALPQPNYLMHLQQHAPEAYPDARSNLVADLLKVRRVMQGQIPEVAGAVADELPF